VGFSKKYKQRQYDERKKLVASIKVASGCMDCKVWGPDEILTFDHVRGKKEFGIGQRWDVGKHRLLKEIEKCEVVCANCHAIRTNTRLKDVMPFSPYPKIPRLNREVIISEKIDGSHGVLWVDGDGDVWAGSRNRWLTLEEDNFGFALWAERHREYLCTLGEGVYHGEWWGQGIQRGYGLDHKRFSLFNTHRWGPVKLGAFEEATPEKQWEELHNPFNTVPGLDVVPVLAQGKLQDVVDYSIMLLREHGSHAAPGFRDPEGIIVFHTALNGMFKMTLESDDAPKSKTNVSGQ